MLPYLKALAVSAGITSGAIAVALLLTIVPGFAHLIDSFRDISTSPFWAIFLAAWILRSGLNEVLVQIGSRVQSGGLRVGLPGGSSVEFTREQEEAIESPSGPTPSSENRPATDSTDTVQLLSQIARLEQANANLSYVAWGERVYGLIYGSQLFALSLMNGLPDRKAPKAQIQQTWEALHRDRGGISPFESWLNFLVSFTLIMVEENEVAITENGRWFLDTFLKERNYSMTKAL